MALRDQPYFPLYVQDYLTDEKLNMCSASSQGVFIKILCIMHKSESYGKILFKQKFKQNESMIKNFALQISKQLPFDAQTIENALHDLIDEGVLILSDDELLQKRMVKDGEISAKRSEAGKSGGGNPNLFKQNSKQKVKQNTENENENENEDKNEIVSIKYANLEKLKNTRQYIENCQQLFNISESEVKNNLDKFWLEKQHTGELERSQNEVFGHFKNWLKKQQNGNNKGFGTPTKRDSAAVIAEADAIIKRAFGH